MIRTRVLPRNRVTPLMSILTLVASLAAGIVIVGIIFAANEVDPFFAMRKIFGGSFGSLYGFKETVTKAIPLLLIGTGLSLAFRGKFWNIGAEGQLLAGAMIATWVALKLGPTASRHIVIPLMFLGGFLGGGLLGLLPAIFKIKFRINEIISTLMLNYIVAEFIQYLIVGPWKGETQFGFPYTDDFAEAAKLRLISASRIHYATLIIAVVAVVLLTIMLYKTRTGYEIRVSGENPDAARYAGINFFRSALLMMLISGGLAGLAGVGEVAGIHYHLSYPYTISSGYGFTAIIVAWLARLNPAFVPFSALFFSGILVGGDAIQISLGLPAATVNIVNGVLLFSLITGEFFLRNRVTLVRRRS